VNVSQCSHEKKKLSKKVVCTQVNCSAWYCQLSPNPHVLAIYLKLVHAHGVAPERFEKYECENDDVHLHYWTWILNDGHYHWLQGPINPLSMKHWAKYLACTILHILDFLQLWYFPSKSFTKS
jgi:hypothetical protein